MLITNESIQLDAFYNKIQQLFQKKGLKGKLGLQKRKSHS